jgi:two-component system sensor histidine kinase/response regulator
MIKNKNKKILIVDDNIVNLEILRNMLGSEGYMVIHASGGREAVQMAKKDLPDLIILDIIMPDIDGGEVASILKRHPRTKNIPIIFLSSLISKKEEKFSSSKKGISLVAKPCRRDELLKQVEVYL